MPSAPPAHSFPPPAIATAMVRPVRRTWAGGLPLVLIALLYLGASFGPALFDQNEAQYAGAVREMLDRPQDYIPATRNRLERGHWYIPTNDGIPRLQKPPLVYWLLMGSMRVCGVNEFGARLPNALFTLLWFWATFLLGRRVGGTAFGVAGTTVLATMAGTFIFSHLIAPEPFLAAFLTLTFWCFASACQQPSRSARWMFLAWVFMGLGVCSKGLHGALYPLMVAGLLAWRHPATRPVWRKLGRPAGWLVFLAILIPWYAAMAARFPGFLRDQFINEQLGHVFNHRIPADYDRVPFAVFWLEHLVLFLPWTFFIPAAVWTSRRPVPGSSAGSLGRDLLVCWFGVTTVTILFSSLQDYYLMTAWPPVAFWLARPWMGGGHERELPGWMRQGPGWCLAAIGVAVLAAAVYLGTHAPAATAQPMAAASLARDNMLTTLAGFSAPVWHELLPLVWAAGALFLTGGAAVVLLAATRSWRAVLTATAVMMAGVLGTAAVGLCVLEDYFSLKQVALAANRLAGPAGEVVCAGEPADNPSLLFYLDREVAWVHTQASGEFASRELGIGRDLFLSDEEFARRWNSPRIVLLVIEADDLARWQASLSLTAAQVQPVARSGTRVLLVNHPSRQS